MTEIATVLITGASGFIGRALCDELGKSPRYQIATAGRSSAALFAGVEHHAHDLLDLEQVPTLTNIDVVIHTAARVHVMRDQSVDKLAAFRAANVAGTRALAQAAAKAGVKRFIYLSSIKVNGECTAQGEAFTSHDAPAPLDPYGVSKLEAERVLREIEARTAMEVVIIRPPMVYGPHVKANFRTMMKALALGVPLPLGKVHNRRSLVSLANLVDLLILCISHPRAGGETFLVSDGEDLSTTQLLQRLASALGRKPILLPIPVAWLALATKTMNKEAIAQRLLASLQVDIRHTRETLGWNPPVTVEEALRMTAQAFQAD